MNAKTAKAPTIIGEANKTRQGYNLSWTCPIFGTYHEADGEFHMEDNHIFHDVISEAEELLYHVKAAV